MQDRREFLKSTCTLCAAAIGFGFLLSEESCKPSSTVSVEATPEKMSVPLSLMKDKSTLVVKNPSLDQPILLVKKSESEYEALLMQCTHKGVELQVIQGQLSCPAHGSKFDLDGTVVHAPAVKALTKFPVTVEGDRAVIRIKKS